MDDTLGGGILALAVSYSITALWMVGTMNAVNFLDGMDGLTAGVVAIFLIDLAGLYQIGGRVENIALSVAFVGAAIVALFLNWLGYSALRPTATSGRALAESGDGASGYPSIEQPTVEIEAILLTARSATSVVAASPNGETMDGTSSGTASQR